MKKLMLPGVLAVFALFLPLKSQAQPLDFPYQVDISTMAFTSITISSTNFPSLVSSVNANVASYQWCIDKVTVAATSAASFTMAWSTSTLSRATTDYSILTVANSTYAENWSERNPYCAPVGYPILKLNSSVSGSTITAKGFLWKGWNP